MNAAARGPNDALLPQPPGGTALGAVLALGAHAALLLALFALTQWRTQVSEVVSAELWSSVPEAAAPAAPPPAPPAAPAPAPPPAPAPTPRAPAPPPAVRTEPPPKVDIAIERAQKERREKERLDKERLEKERVEKERAERERRQAEAETARREREQQAARQAAAAEQARLERTREEQLRRMMSQAGTGAVGTTEAPATASSSPAGRGAAARDAAPSNSYAARLASLIRSQIVFTGEVPGNPAAEVEVRAASNGTIISRRIVKSSGHAAWDEAVQRALDRVGTLPRDVDGRVPSTLIIAFRPKE